MLRLRRHPQTAASRAALNRPLLQASFVAALLGAVALVGLFPIRVAGVTTTPLLQATRLSLPGLAADGPVTTTSDALVSRAVPLTLMATASEAGSFRTVNPNAGVQGQANGDIVNAAGTPQDKIPVFFEYKVQEGDTISGIAARFGIRSDYVTWNNADVSNINALTPGQTLQIPSIEGIIHSVRLGETVSQIADRYDAKASDIIQFKANGLAGDPNKLSEGSLILVNAPRRSSSAKITSIIGFGRSVRHARKNFSNASSRSAPQIGLSLRCGIL